MSLLKKSEQNLEISEIAMEKEYYDVAMSRLYYSCFQRVLYFFEKKELSIGNEEKVQEGSHNATIKLIKNYVKLFYKKYVVIIAQLEDLKKYRKIADYDNRIIKKSEYKEIKENGLDIINILDKILKES